MVKTLYPLVFATAMAWPISAGLQEFATPSLRVIWVACSTAVVIWVFLIAFRIQEIEIRDGVVCVRGYRTSKQFPVTNVVSVVKSRWPRWMPFQLIVKAADSRMSSIWFISRIPITELQGMVGKLGR